MRKITKMHEKCEKTKFCQENEKNKKKLRILCENLKKKRKEIIIKIRKTEQRKINFSENGAILI